MHNKSPFLQIWSFCNVLSAFSDNTKQDEPASGRCLFFCKKSQSHRFFFPRSCQEITNSFSHQNASALCKPMWPSARMHRMNSHTINRRNRYLTLWWHFIILKIAKEKRFPNSFDLWHLSGVFSFTEALVCSFIAVCGNLSLQGWKEWAVMSAIKLKGAERERCLNNSKHFH